MEWTTLVFDAVLVLTFLAVGLHVARSPAKSLDTALIFASLAGVVVLARLIIQLGGPHQAPLVAATIVGLSFSIPYLFLSLVDEFSANARRIRLISGVALLALFIANIVALATIGPRLPFLSAIAFVGLTSYCAIRFLHAARNRRGIARRRFQSIAFGSAVLTLAVPLIGARVWVPALVTVEFEVLTELAVAVAAVAFVMGFSPPVWLRRVWQEPELRSFMAGSSALALITDEQELLEAIADCAQTTLGASGGSIALWDPTTSRLTTPNQSWLSDIALKDTVSGVAFLEQRPVLTLDPEREFPEVPRRYPGARMRAIIAAPITSGARRIGVLRAFSHQAPLFVEDDLGLAQMLADQAAILIDNRSLLAAARAENREMRIEIQAQVDREERMHYDNETGLPNATLFQEHLQAVVADSAGNSQQHGVLLLDIENFREVFALVGHAAADLILREVADRLRKVVRPIDVLARVRGDQFAVLVLDAREEELREIALWMLTALQYPFDAAGEVVELDPRIGMAFYPEHGALLLSCASDALTDVMQASSSLAVYAGYTDAPQRTKLALRSDLRRAIDSDEISVMYQPLVSMRSRGVVRVEALARWTDSHHRVVPPEEFIAVAERSGLVRPLTDAVLRKALRDLQQWRKSIPDLRVAVNLSASLFAHPGLTEHIRSILDQCGCDASQLALEVTESVLMQDPDRARRTMASLREMGVRIDIDDFGTGYSSLAYLQRLPVNSVKIDRQFVAEMQESRGSAAIVRATISLGHELGFEVVSEGVEDQTTWNLLAALGCDTAQGYLVGRPMPVPEFDIWLDGWLSGVKATQAMAVARIPEMAEATPAAHRRVLVVDDDSSILSIVRYVLEDAGYEVHTAANGDEALKVLSRAMPALILMDINMPMLDGPGLARAVRERGLRMPIVVMTAGPGAEKWAKEMGADDFLAKPFDVPRLLSVTGRLAHQSLN